MKNIYFLLAFLITSMSFGQIWTEDFNAYTDGTGIEGSTGGVIVNIGDYPASVTKWSLDATGAALTASSDFAKTSGGLFVFQDIDGPLIWDSEMIDISGATSPVNFELTASNNAGGFETSDFFDVFYSVDGGAFTLIPDWNGLGDAMHTIIGEKNSVDWGTIETIQVTGLSGSTLQIRVQAVNNAGGEQFLFDNVTVTEGALPPSISITSPTNGTIFNPGTTSANVEWVTANLGGSETVSVTVNGSTTTNATTPFPVTIADGMMYNVTVELIDGGILDSDMTSFSVGSLTSVADLAAVRADYNANGTGAFYSLQSTPTVTYARANRNQKYIQDVSAGILIDDSPGTITTTFVEGDGMTGLVGQVSEFSGVMQFIPIQDASVAAGSTVTPEVVTLAQIIANQEAYESELVQIDNLTFALGDGVNVFAASTNYDISDPALRAMSVFRSNFSEADYIGQLIPTGAVSITTLVGEFNGTPQITSRTLSDLTLSNDEFGISNFAIYPNPTSTGFVNIKTSSGNSIAVTVFDILGKRVLSQSIENETLDVSSLKAGIYVMKITQDNSTTSKKLVIK